jgi:hypothetical protein
MFTCSSPTTLQGSLHQVVDQLVAEERECGPGERRSAHRQPFMRPVSVHPRREPGTVWQAFSKNVSSQGLGLVTPHAVEIGTIAKLGIHRTVGPAVHLLAECRWCDTFGDGWFVHGWNFINVARPES